MKKLYLHIGAPKSGSTAIQHFLMLNRDLWASEGYGIYFPFDVSEEDLLNLWDMSPIWTNFRTRDVDGFMKYVNETNFHAYILSDEMLFNKSLFFNFAQKKLHVLENNFKITIILYLRRIDDVTFSMWRWHTKFLYTNGAFNPFFDNVYKYWDIKSIIQQIQHYLPEAEIKIRSYSFPLYNDIIMDFVNACDTSRRDWDYKVSKPNKSPSIEVCHSLLHLKKVYGLSKIYPGIYNGLTDAALECSKEYPSSGAHALSYQDRYKLCRAVDESTKWVEEKFFNKNPIYGPIPNDSAWIEDTNRTYEIADAIKKRAESKGFIFPDNPISL